MTPRSAFSLVLLLLCSLCTGCSHFDARWKAAATNSKAERWDGRWTSEHHKTASGSAVGGRLRAVTEPGANRELVADFHANWKIFASDYTMKFKPKAGPRRDGVQEFSGTHELPKTFGGTYRYEAQLVGDQLTALYTSSYDHGTFTLKRVQMSKECCPAHARH